MRNVSIEEIDVVLKMLKKINKIIKANEFTNKWYESGNIKIHALFNGIVFLPIVEVYRQLPQGEKPNKLDMDKAVKDRITRFLKDNDCIYFERYECYLYGGHILKQVKKNHPNK